MSIRLYANKPITVFKLLTCKLFLGQIRFIHINFTFSNPSAKLA